MLKARTEGRSHTTLSPTSSLQCVTHTIAARAQGTLHLLLSKSASRACTLQIDLLNLPHSSSPYLAPVYCAVMLSARHIQSRKSSRRTAARAFKVLWRALCQQVPLLLRAPRLRSCCSSMSLRQARRPLQHRQSRHQLRYSLRPLRHPSVLPSVSGHQYDSVALLCCRH
jgi:hypothetical protein